MKRINLVTFHGVGDSPKHYSREWSQFVSCQVRPEYAVFPFEVHWEPLRDVDRICDNVANWIGDLSAVWDEDVIGLGRAMVMKANLEDGVTWVMGHSLGSVLAWRVLSDCSGVSARRLITLGSPLAKMESYGTLKYITRPQHLFGPWRNVACITDWVCHLPWKRCWRNPALLARPGWIKAADNRLCWPPLRWWNCHSAASYFRTAAMRWAVACHG